MPELAQTGIVEFRPLRRIEQKKPEIFNPSKAWVKNRPHALENVRLALGLTVAELAKRSRTERHVVKNILCGRRKPHAATLRRLEHAIAEVQEERRGEVCSRYEGIVRAICYFRHVSARQVLATDFSRQRPRNRVWLARARICSLARYILIVEFGTQEAAVAAAIDKSRTAISKLLPRYEKQRDREPRLERLIAAVKFRVGS